MRSRLFAAACAALAGSLIAAGPASAKLKTAKECNAEYAANKADIQANHQTKTAFLKACRAQDEGTAAPAAATAPAATTSPAPTSRSSQTTPAASGRPTGENQFTTESAARAHCPGAPVVWVNNASHVYHFAGTRYYGRTRSGAYMCERDAVAANDRASKTEKHP